ncbi:MAG: TRAP transporter substrate-binding protein DctP [Polyangiaceae bacterium]|jgi:TRAP-type mannitol/chloroaromatic compound transport system substrate-binding protein
MGGRRSPPSNPVTWRVQTHIGGNTTTFHAFKRFCTSVGELSEGRLVFEAYPAGAIVGAYDMFEALKTGLLDCGSYPPLYPADKHPEFAFLSSYPLGLDRPDQWETWFYELGGLELARKMHEPHNIRFVGPVQHDLNIIHSTVPIRSFEDFRGKKLRMPGGLIADVFATAGARTISISPDQIYTALANGSIEAADFVGPAVNLELGFGRVAKYIILGPPATPSIHQPCDILCVLANMKKWRSLSSHLQSVVEYAVRGYSWDHYTAIQKANTLSWDQYAARGVEIIRLSDADVAKFRAVAIPVWFKWAKMSPLAREAFASQLAYMKSPAVDYVDDGKFVDAEGKRLSLDD